MTNKGFTFYEVLISVSVFTVVILGSFEAVKYFSGNVKYLSNIVYSDTLSNNGTYISKNILLNLSDIEWSTYLAAAEIGPLDMRLSYNNGEYLLEQSKEYEGPIDVFSRSVSNDQDTQFYRKLILTKIENWGLFEIQGKVCFDECDYYAQSFVNFQRQ